MRHNEGFLTIRQATEEDFDGIWAIFSPIVKAGETYAYAPDTSKEQARAIWLEAPRATYVAVEDASVLGTYYLKANQPDLGAHVCNAGYMVGLKARGKGLGRAMCLHSQTEAVKLGFKAMQFNLVVCSNEAAIRLWQDLGFATVGTLPKAFKHSSLGYVDALVMYKWLATPD